MNTRETIIDYTEYTYDKRGRRIRSMKLYPPEEHADALIKTEFFYEGAGDVPVSAEVTSVVERRCGWLGRN